MRAEIISVGTELLLGELVDTNASFLASELPRLGIDLYWISQVGDNQIRLVEILKRAWQRSDLILITGGLGPTEDDLTREAIAELSGEEPKLTPALVCDLQDFFTRLGIEMTPNNMKQATLIPSAQPIRNVNGTAPGWWVEKDERMIIAMPGPPREMQPMWSQEVLPRLCQSVTGATIISKTFKIFGLAEAKVDEMMSPLLSSPNPTLGVYAKIDIHLRLTAKAQSQRQTEEMIASGEVRLRSILGRYIWGTDSDTLESVVGHMLSEKRLSLAVMEGYTGGLLGATITNVLDTSAYFKGGLIAGSDKSQVAFGVDAKLISDYGIGSAEAAQAMAESARLHLWADIGVGIDGVDEPSEGGDRPVGTIHIGIDDGKSKKAITTRYPGDRAWVKRRVVNATLFELSKILATVQKDKSNCPVE